MDHTSNLYTMYNDALFILDSLIWIQSYIDGLADNFTTIVIFVGHEPHYTTGKILIDIVIISAKLASLLIITQTTMHRMHR